MKFILTFLLTLCISVAFAQAEKEVETAIQNLKAAMLAEDEAALKTLTSENLTYGHSSGVIENQEEFLAVFAAKKTDYQKWDISDQTITFHGKDLAMVRHKVSAEIASNGKTNPLNIGLLMVWVKEKGSWKLLARQAFRLPV
jgi:ketosteroid isomerase-like protein